MIIYHTIDCNYKLQFCDKSRTLFSII